MWRSCLSGIAASYPSACARGIYMLPMGGSTCLPTGRSTCSPMRVYMLPTGRSTCAGRGGHHPPTPRGPSEALHPPHQRQPPMPPATRPLSRHRPLADLGRTRRRSCREGCKAAAPKRQRDPEGHWGILVAAAAAARPQREGTRHHCQRALEACRGGCTKTHRKQGAAERRRRRRAAVLHRRRRAAVLRRRRSRAAARRRRRAAVRRHRRAAARLHRRAAARRRPHGVHCRQQGCCTAVVRRHRAIRRRQATEGRRMG